MPTYKGVEVWLEDSEKRKLNHEHVAIDLVNDNPVTLKARTKMHRDELYTVHCLTPISIFCDVFVTVRSGVRQCAARFHIEKSLSISDNALGSSEGHTEYKYKDMGLRAPKRCFQQGKLATVEVEIRRTAPIIKEEPTEDHAVDEDEQDALVFSMIDDFDRPPWLLFVFDVTAKGPPNGFITPNAPQVAKQVLRKVHRKQASSTGGIPSTRSTCPSDETPRPDQNLPDIPRASSSLQREYEKEEAEERRLLEILLARLDAKRTSNMELRRLLGETA
ncbi:hypothetical protein JVU11DRAFT_2790 [Chiua virens]|nr:hypothetical protein JVU11DRAFT_2790 [Chiua virens]